MHIWLKSICSNQNKSTEMESIAYCCQQIIAFEVIIGLRRNIIYPCEQNKGVYLTNLY
jgi:hypothetical protein